MDEKWLSVAEEPALDPNHQGTPDPAEDIVSPIPSTESIPVALRDSVWSEPSQEGAPQGYREYYQQRRQGISEGVSWLAVLSTALVAGPAAVFGTFFSGRSGAFGILYLCLMGPVVEEFMKQAGAIWLVEKRPWLIREKSQLIILAIITAI